MVDYQAREEKNQDIAESFNDIGKLQSTQKMIFLIYI